MKAVLVVSHGSRSPKTKEEVSRLVETLRHRLPGTIIEFAFLEIEPPSIPQGIDKCVAQGTDAVTVALNFLNAGRHVNDDIPAIIAQARQKYPHVTFAMTQPVGQHPQIPDLFIDLINNADQ
jgi:sirohydrochlorin ferrochelatase